MPVSQFPASISLGDLNGNNGFAITGIFLGGDSDNYDFGKTTEKQRAIFGIFLNYHLSSTGYNP